METIRDEFKHLADHLHPRRTHRKQVPEVRHKNVDFIMLNHFFGMLKQILSIIIAKNWEKKHQFGNISQIPTRHSSISVVCCV